jgi:hypothetical protein
LKNRLKTEFQKEGNNPSNRRALLSFKRRISLWAGFRKNAFKTEQPEELLKGNIRNQEESQRGSKVCCLNTLLSENK